MPSTVVRSLCPCRNILFSVLAVLCKCLCIWLQRSRQPNDEWEIPPNEILIGARVGSGSFGTVFKGHWHGRVRLRGEDMACSHCVMLMINRSSGCQETECE